MWKPHKEIKWLEDEPARLWRGGRNQQEFLTLCEVK